MPYSEPHGGGCCGMTHIRDFYTSVSFDMKRLATCINTTLDELRADNGIDDDKPFGHLFEVVLTDQQMQTYSEAMKEKGFRLVNRFYNANSGNYCNILHLAVHQPRGKSRRPRPYQW